MLSNDQRIQDTIGIMAHIRDIQANGLNNVQNGSNSQHNTPIINQVYLYRERRDDLSSSQQQEPQQKDGYAGIKVLKQWIKTGETNNIKTIEGADIVKFFVQAENDQYARTHPNLNIYKDPDDIFNRGTSWWFRSDQKKRANYLYELIEGDLKNKYCFDKISIRDKKNTDQQSKDLGLTIDMLYNTEKGRKYSHPGAAINLLSLKQRLQAYHPGCCCCCP